jgi:glycosyltransferase involved in cell wall biosynthesis
VAFRRLESEGRIRFLDGYVQDAVEPDLLAAADCMWLGYIDFYGMSGVLVLAARHGVPVLAAHDGLIGYLARRYALGAVIEPRNRSSVVGALNRVAAEPEFFRRAGENAASAFEAHDPRQFKSLVAQTIAMNT